MYNVTPFVSGHVVIRVLSQEEMSCFIEMCKLNDLKWKGGESLEILPCEYKFSDNEIGIRPNNGGKMTIANKFYFKNKYKCISMSMEEYISSYCNSIIADKINLGDIMLF